MSQQYYRKSRSITYSTPPNLFAANMNAILETPPTGEKRASVAMCSTEPTMQVRNVKEYLSYTNHDMICY